MTVRIVVDEVELRRVQGKLGELAHKAPNVIANSLNRSIANMKSNIPKEIRKDYHVKAKDIKETLKVFKANASDLRGEVKSSGKVLGLNKFKVSPGTVNPRRKGQLKIAVRKDGMKVIPGAFNANLNGVKVFKRTGYKSVPTKGSYKGRIVTRGPNKGQLLKREEIERKMGPSVPQMLSNEGKVKEIESQAWQTYEKNLNHYVNRLLSKL